MSRWLTAGLAALLALSGCSAPPSQARPAPAPTAPSAGEATTTTTTLGPTTVVPATLLPTTLVPTTLVPTTLVPTTVTVPAPAGTALAIDLLAYVRVENEHRGGYVRDLFGYPADFGHSCDTRAEVLRRDSLVTPQITRTGCTVISGEWRSPYDGLVLTTASQLQIDHVVALKEAWDSGAWAWNPAKRHAFANDIADPRTLRPASTASNQDKGDKDPSNWLPPDAADVCSYVGDWVEIKLRWGLSMDQSEFGRIRNLLRGPCAGWRVSAFEAVSPSLG